LLLTFTLRPIYFPGKYFPSPYSFRLVMLLSCGRLQPFLTLLQRSCNSVVDSCVHLAENRQSNLLHVLSDTQLLNLFLSIRRCVRTFIRSSFTAWHISGLWSGYVGAPPIRHHLDTFEGLTAETMTITIFWVVTSCSLVELCPRFMESRCLHLCSPL